MKRQRALLLIICCLQGMAVHLKAETITYDFSSTEFWFTTSHGNTHPKEGASLGNIYYQDTEYCFVGKSNDNNKDNNVYFSNDGYGGLMIKTGATLKIPNSSDWIVNRVIIHSHRLASSSAKVNIYDSHSGATTASTALTWSANDEDYVYEIRESFKVKGTSLYIRALDNNARIASITIDYTSLGGSSGDTSTDIPVAAPMFNPASMAFSTESLDVAISAAEGCDVYYTTDGTTKPSYANADTFVGTKGNAVTIAAADSKVTLQAIAVDPITGKCSEVSSATYTYVPIVNDGSEEKPYTVAEVKAMTKDYKDKWVKGVIYGTMVNDDIKDVVTSDFNSKANIVIGDAEVQIPIQLPEGKIRNEINLVDHPYLVGREILIRGTLTGYCGSWGVTEPIAYKITYDVPINSYGYATLFLDMPVSVSQSSNVYYCTTEGDVVKLLPVPGRVVPANVGVIIESSPNTTCKLSYTAETNPYENSIRESNQLMGYIEDTYIVGSDNAYYALNAKEGKVGFYIPKTMDANGGFTAKANKAYLQVPAESQATMYLLPHGNDETTIVPVIHLSGEIFYDLQGRVVSFPTAGVYIKAGKKIIIK